MVYVIQCVRVGGVSWTVELLAYDCVAHGFHLHDCPVDSRVVEVSMEAAAAADGVEG